MPSPVRARRFAAPRGLPLPNRTLRVLREGVNLVPPALSLQNWSLPKASIRPSALVRLRVSLLR